jgi:hypothetical protein
MNTIGKASAIAAGFIGAVALGVAIGPVLTHRGDSAPVTPTPAWDLSQPSAETSGPAATAPATPATPARVAPEPRPKSAIAKAEKADRSARRPAAKVALSTPALVARLKPVLNRGANMKVAADGFKDAEQFATVAHAARNTKVPFMVLKHHVLDEKRSLADAIRAANPSLDGNAEARRARTEARSDIAAVASSSAN